MGLPESLLEQDVEEGLGNGVLAVNESIVKMHRRLCALVDGDDARLVLVGRLHSDSLFQGCQSEDHLAGGDVRAQKPEQTSVLLKHDVVDDRGLEDLVWAHRQSVLIRGHHRTNIQMEVVRAE